MEKLKSKLAYEVFYSEMGSFEGITAETSDDELDKFPESFEIEYGVTIRELLSKTGCNISNYHQKPGNEEDILFVQATGVLADNSMIVLTIKKSKDYKSPKKRAYEYRDMLKKQKTQAMQLKM